ncbi:MAG: precorrin-4 C(11)-methyltransferase [Ardenticatenaceae bacterium]
MSNSTTTLYPVMPGTVYFIGAGPGAPDLMTIRARDIIAQSDLVLYADSLVDERVGDFAPPGAEVLGSLKMHLEVIMARMIAVAQGGGVVARVHSGDPALYGATHEQMVRLEAAGVPYEIVPGVTVAFAAAALLKTELTVPNVVQTIILTRISGRTSVPEGEALADLARSGASIAIYLSITRIKKVVRELLAGGRYTPETPVAVLHRVAWPDESYVVGTLDNIADKVRQAGYTRQALILVSPALDQKYRTTEHASSHLYDSGYTHRFRRAADPDKENVGYGPKRKRAPADDKRAPQRSGTAIVAITKAASQLAQQLAPALSATAYIPSKHNVGAIPRGCPPDDCPPSSPSAQAYEGSVLPLIRRLWHEQEHLVLLMPMGVAVRAIGSLAQDKRTDPAVVVADEQGQHVIPTLGGHLAGANELARQVAALTGGKAILTTASDVQGLPALDLWIKEHDLVIENPELLTTVTAALVNGETVGTVAPAPWQKPLASFNKPAVTLDDLMQDTYSAGLVISDEQVSDAYEQVRDKVLLLRPPSLVVGVGCRRGASADEIEQAIRTTLKEAGLAAASVSCLASAWLKADEPGLLSVSEQCNWPLYCYEAEMIKQVQPLVPFSPSAASERFGIPGVAEPCALLASDSRELVVAKRAFERVTVAVARKAVK